MERSSKRAYVYVWQSPNPSRPLKSHSALGDSVCKLLSALSTLNKPGSKLQIKKHMHRQRVSECGKMLQGQSQYFVISWVLLCSTAPSVCTYFVMLIVPREIPLFLPADGFDRTNSLKQGDIACSSPFSLPAPKILLSTNDM